MQFFGVIGVDDEGRFFSCGMEVTVADVEVLFSAQVLLQ